METLIINEDVKKNINRIIKLAESKVTPFNAVKELSEKNKRVEGLNAEFTIEIPLNIIATYTHEEQAGGVICRHLSISSKFKKSLPIKELVELLMIEYGFINRNTCDVAAWVEDCGQNIIAVNLVEPLNGDMNEIMKIKRSSL